MRMTTVILAFLSSYNSPEISIYDSKTVPGHSWILVDDCAVEIKTSDMKTNLDKVIKKINDVCHLDLDDVGQKE